MTSHNADRDNRQFAGDATTTEISLSIEETNKLRASRSESEKTGRATKRNSQQKQGLSNQRKEDEDEDDDVDAANLAGAKVKIGIDDLEAGEEMILTLEDKGILDAKGNLIEDDEVALENVQHREERKRSKAFRDAGKKTGKPLWEEDGRHRSLLDKYDEEEEEMYELDDAGAIEASKVARQDNIRAKLEASKKAALDDGIDVSNITLTGANGGDYYTPEEMAAMRKPRKKKERKLKKKALTADDLAALEEQAKLHGGSDLGSRAEREKRAEQLVEAEIAADKERRSRFDAALSKANYASLALKDDNDGMKIVDEEEDEELYQSLRKARELAAKKAAQSVNTEDDLAQQLLKRRQQASNTSFMTGTAPSSMSGGLQFTDISEFTRGIAVKQEHGAIPVKPLAQEEFPTITTRIKEEDNMDVDTDVKKEEEDIDHKFVDDEMVKKGQEGDEDGYWRPAAHDDELQGENIESNNKKAMNARNRNYRQRSTTKDDDDARNGDIIHGHGRTTGEASGGALGSGSERTIGAGLGGALAFLKERGELKETVEWAGRMNDSRNSYFTNAMGGYKDVFTGGRTGDRLALDVEVALTRKDEFGRILTPKEAFRQLCYDFHGVKPSKNTQEKRAKQIAKELAQRKAATATTSGTIAGLKAVQEAVSAPYMVLSGTIRPGQSRDAAGGYATVEKRSADGGGRSAAKTLGLPPQPPSKKKSSKRKPDP